MYIDRVEKAKQETNEAHSLHGQIPAERRLKSRNCFLYSVPPANPPPPQKKVIRCSEWPRRTNKTPHRTSVNLDKSLVRGHDSPWTTWGCLNRLLTGYTCSREQRKKLQYFDGDTTCVCGIATENTAHMLQCTLFVRPCTLDDLSKTQQSIAQKDGRQRLDDTMMMMMMMMMGKCIY